MLVLPFGGIPGKAVSAFLVLLSLAGMTLGLVFWRGRRVLSARESGFFSGLLALAVLTLAGFGSILLGSWLIGLACVILVLLITIALATRYWGEI